MNKRWISLSLALLLTVMTVLPVVAASETTSLSGPLDWPIVGPILKLLGIGEEEDVVIETRTQNLQEYRIEDLDDVKELQDIPHSETVRIVASDTVANEIIADLIETYDVSDVSAEVSFEENLLKADIEVSMDFLEQFEFEMPVFQNAENLEIELSADINDDSCHAVVDLEKVTINNWSFGLRAALEPIINNWIPEQWPYDVICLENVIISEGEIAVEGFRVAE